VKKPTLHIRGEKISISRPFFLGDQGKKYLAYITRYLIEEYLGIPTEQFPHCVGAKTLWDYRLRHPARIQKS
jgi:hypothetical protein